MFLPTRTIKENSSGGLYPKSIYEVWNHVCKSAGVEGKSPHSARYAMGRYIIKKTGNILAIQRRLGYKNPAYSMLYSRITGEELKNAQNDR